MGKRFFLVMVALLAMSSVRAQRSSLCPLRMVEADSVMLYDFFWCDAARWADTIAAGSAKAWPWQPSELDSVQLAARVAEWESQIGSMRLQGTMVDSVTSADEVLPMLRESVELGLQTREARFFDVAERIMANPVIRMKNYYELRKTRHGDLAGVLRSVGSVAYATQAHDVYINMFVRSNVHVVNDDIDFYMQVFNGSPWYNDTSIRITKDMNPIEATADTVLSHYQRLIVREEAAPDSVDINFHIRIPSWVNGQDMLPRYTARARRQPVVIFVNGSVVTPQMEDGYAVIRGRWAVQDLITITMPTPILRVSDREAPGMVALQRGPIVYNSTGTHRGMVFDAASPVSHYFDRGINAIVLQGNIENRHDKIRNEFVPYYRTGPLRIFEKAK